MNSDEITALCERLRKPDFWKAGWHKQGAYIERHLQVDSAPAEAATTLAALNAKCAELESERDAALQWAREQHKCADEYAARIVALEIEGEQWRPIEPRVVADPDNLCPVHIRLLQRGCKSRWIGLTDDAGTHMYERAALGELERAGLVRASDNDLPPGPPLPRSFEITDAGRTALKDKTHG